MAYFRVAAGLRRLAPSAGLRVSAKLQLEFAIREEELGKSVQPQECLER
jgi:hypothetical protein